ncbi:MAG TPA: hypothetical protein VK530_09335, partial [Candidatus Acidoferrum sp.]|nr:hypothetical protein [Candidatus Acidoferrum sp.]
MEKWFSQSFVRYAAFIFGAVLAGVIAFEVLDISVFQRFGSPHAICYLASPKMIWLHVTSDALIGIAYVSISLTISFLVYRASEDIPFHWMFLAFGLFIVSCGFTHFMEVLVIWQPLYWLSGYVKVVTAAASVATAIALFSLVPKVFLLIDSVRKTELRRKKIETLNEELDAFTSSVAHDLRAPLRAIAGMSLALREDYGDSL